MVTREGAELRDGIAGFYDASTPVWDDVWGEHLHHGYYPGGKSRKDHQQAQARRPACGVLAAAQGGEGRSVARVPSHAAWLTAPGAPLAAPVPVGR